MPCRDCRIVTWKGEGAERWIMPLASAWGPAIEHCPRPISSLNAVGALPYAKRYLSNNHGDLDFSSLKPFADFCLKFESCFVPISAFFLPQQNSAEPTAGMCCTYSCVCTNSCTSSYKTENHLIVAHDWESFIRKFFACGKVFLLVTDLLHLNHHVCRYWMTLGCHFPRGRKTPPLLVRRRLLMRNSCIAVRMKDLRYIHLYPNNESTFASCNEDIAHSIHLFVT